MIEARDIVVRGAARRLLLDSVSVTLRPGTFTAVLGPNGAGKTTLLRAMSGELAPDHGAVLLDGRRLRDFGRLELARRRAVLGQHQTLEFGFTVEDVVTLGRLPHDGTAGMRDDAAAIAAARDAFGLAPFWRRSYPTLSGGERQRVQLARVAAQLWRPAGAQRRETVALFLDEPTAALDLAQQGIVLDVARSMAARGAVVVAILHDLNQALMADAAVLLRGGQLLAAGPAAATLQPDMLEACFGVPIDRVERAGGGVALLPRAAPR